MSKGFAVGDLVRIAPSVLVASGLDPVAAGGLLVVNAEDEPWMGLEQFEVRNSDGDSFGLLASSLVHV